MRFISLFSGIGGFDLALERAGFTCDMLCEIDLQARGVLQRHFPHARIIEDVRDVGKETHERGSISLICGGFPCQDLSVAGKRAGLAGERSGLWFEFARVIDELEPQWVVVENVPGLLSSNGGRDFAVIVRWLAERGYGVAWRVLDAQYFGVAQRRRRVFIVGSLGDGRAAQVLFESEGVSRDSEKGREAREGAAGTAAPLTASGRGPERAGESRGQDTVIPVLLSGNEVVRTLNSRHDSSPCADRGMEVIAYTIQQNDGGNHKRKDRPNGGMYVSEAETSLTVGSTDQTVVAMHETGQGFWQEGDVAGTLRAEGENRPSRPSNVVAMDVRNLTETDDVSIPLQAKPNGGYSLNFQPVVAFTQNTREEVRQIGGDGQVAGALGAEPRAHQQNYIAFQPRYFTRDNKTGGAPSDTVDITNAHKAGDSAPVLAFQSKASATNSLNPSEITPGLDVGKGDGLSVVGAFGVRRLTPTECERLQGFPDGWTKYRKFLFEDTEIEQADSARYRQLGNAVAVPVVEWIAKRIAQFRPTPFGADAEQQQATGDDEPAPLKPGR